MTVPVHVVAGFLGTGKTTTLSRLLRGREGERIAVVVNDFGEGAIDREVVGEGEVRIAEIQGACVCCTAPEDFTQAIGKLLDEVRPDRIFVEPTGLARPADIVDTLRRGPHRDRVRLAPVVVLVDPAALDPQDDLLREQGEAADVLVANRVDLASEQELARFDAWVGSLWPGPERVLRTTFGQLPADVLEGAPKPRDHHHDHDHSTEGFVARSRIWPADTVFSRDRLVAAFADLRDLARAKGLFRTEEGTFLVEIAGGRVHERPSSYRRDSRVDLIFRGDGRAAEAEQALDAAVLRPEELARSGERLEILLPDGRRESFDRDDLAALPGGIEDVSALIPKREGAAARVAALLDRIEAPADAQAVVVATDGLATAPVPVQVLREAVLVHSLAGETLPAKQGGPFRLLIPAEAAAGVGGPCANVKGVARIVLRRG